MHALFGFLRRFQVLMLFLSLQSFAIVTHIQRQGPWSVYAFQIRSFLFAKAQDFQKEAMDYVHLRTINKQLQDENKQLQQALLGARETQNTYVQDVNYTIDTNYHLHTARVLSNTVAQKRNFIMLSKGSNDGIEPGMGVIDAYGVVGHIKHASKHFALAYSLLHIDMLLSVLVQRNGVLGTLRWMGNNAKTAQLDYIPRHVYMQAGDIIVTSGYDGVFLAQIPVAVVRKVGLKPGEMFYDIEVKLSSRFHALHHVYILENKYKTERDSLMVLKQHIP